jgi:2-polyprenyl-3-methyl-5-hydroxy-6-metoxy-1,4-benzoquinol methylase
LKIWLKNPTLEAFLVDFNQHVRFTFIAKSLGTLLQLLNVKKSDLLILDVGAGLGTLSSYIDREIDCFTVNAELNPTRKLRNLVVADGRALPFRDSSFDFIVSSDVLEHIKAEDRACFASELVRCTIFGLSITYSKLHAGHPSQSGIRVFERICSGRYPSWYLEHIENKIINDAAFSSALEEKGVHVVEFKPLAGVLTLFFTGLQCRLTVQVPRFLLNLTAYFTTKLIDPPPHYGFGLTALKTKH